MKKKIAPVSMRLPFWEKGEMTEKLLQYIWQFQYFNHSSLQTCEGDALEILSAGRHNKDQGPDFLDAQIKLNAIIIAGTIELHLHTADWLAHGHHRDRNYRNVILHVVYEHDEAVALSVPVLELQPRIPKLLLEQYHQWMQAGNFIPCGSSLRQVPGLNWLAWKDRVLAERLTRKSDEILVLLEQTGRNWEEVGWRLLARNFGMPVNTDAFEAIARSLPVRLVARHREQIHQLEGLLLGQAGLLQSSFNEAYPQLLQREYFFLKKKYSLQPIPVPVYFLRMRPPNFPTIRLAQLAALLQNQPRLFPCFLETENLSFLREALTVTANDYWHTHYLFDEESAFRKKVVGRGMVDNLVVNTVVPLLFAHGRYYKDEVKQERALHWLAVTGAEENTVVKGFAGLGLPSVSAFDSQAVIELKKQYCDRRCCLQCGVGHALLKT